MLVLDNTLLCDYLDGHRPAESFLRSRAERPWATPSLVCYEAFLGVEHGQIDVPLQKVRSAIESSMEVLPVSEQTAWEAVQLQSALMERGVPASTTDVLIAASALEHGGALATGDRHFWSDDVRSHLAVEAYDRSSPDGEC